MCRSFCALIVAMSWTVAPASYALLIDSFDVTQSLGANSSTTSSNGLATGSSIVGGERDATVDFISGPNSADLDINPGSNSLLNLSNGANTLGSATLLYDGAGGIGLGGVDMTDGGATNGIGIEIAFDDLPVNLIFTVTDVFASVGTSTITTSGGIFSPTQVALAFASFSGAVDFSAVDSILIEVVPLQAATDIQIDFIETVLVPEPGALAMLATVGMALAVRRRGVAFGGRV